MTPASRIAFEAVEPFGTTIMLVRCPCGAGGRPGGCGRPNVRLVPALITAALVMGLLYAAWSWVTG